MSRAAILGCLALLVSAFPARADAIDGQWCFGTSHFEISGQDIRTPRGAARSPATMTAMALTTSCP